MTYDLSDQTQQTTIPVFGPNTSSGPGVTGSTFDPNAAGVGIHVLTYSYTDGNGCIRVR